MHIAIPQTIRQLRLYRNLSQESLADALGVSTQAVSKWECGKALPDITILPRIAQFFHISIDTLFEGILEGGEEEPTEARPYLEQNRSGWDCISETQWHGTILPDYGPFTPSEEELHLLGNLQNKTVLELACGSGHSLLYAAQRGARELWGLDISSKQVEAAERLLTENGKEAFLFNSPMEQNPGIPLQHFDVVYSIYGLGWSVDLQKVFHLAHSCLKRGGIFVFSWDNPLLPCLEYKDESYILERSYVDEFRFHILKKGEELSLKNWKLSSYINGLAEAGFRIERLIEESAGAKEDASWTDTWYSAHKAKLLHHTFIVKARKE